jgi:phosphohistidine phosphatase SixA
VVDLILFRHGPAEERDPRKWPEDTDRPLSREGILETRRAAEGLARLEPAIDRVASSGALRARRTAELLREALGLKPPVSFWEELLPDSPAPPVLSRFATEVRAGRVPVLVGHEPTLGELVGYALTGEAVSLARLGRAGAVGLTFPRSVAPGAAQISWMLGRRALARLAR